MLVNSQVFFHKDSRGDGQGTEVLIDKFVIVLAAGWLNLNVKGWNSWVKE